MNVTITNLGTISLPLASSNGDGLAVALEPGVPYTLDDDEIVVASAGDNPTFREEVQEAFKAVLAVLLRLITFWREQQTTTPPHMVHVQIDNHGRNALRVLLGSNVNEVVVSSGATDIVAAPEYVEIRELGV